MLLIQEWGTVHVILKRVNELPLIYKCFLWLSDEDHNEIEVLKLLYVLNVAR